MIPTPEDIIKMIRNLRKTLNDIEVYQCPACSKKFDVEAVRKYTDIGKCPVCVDCGEELVPVEEGD